MGGNRRNQKKWNIKKHARKKIKILKSISNRHAHAIKLRIK